MSIGHDEYGRRIAEAYEAGAKRERKRIAAWLRERAAYCEARGDMDRRRRFNRFWTQRNWDGCSTRSTAFTFRRQWRTTSHGW